MEQKNQPSVSPKPSSNKTVLILVIVFALLLFLGGGGYLVWKFVIQKKIQTLASTPKTTVTLTPSPSLSPAVSPIATPTATPTSATTASGLKTGTMPVNSYVISDSNSRVIAESELSNLTPWQLKVARNEIYARYGRPFVHKDLQCYFAHQSWYHGNPNYSETMLSVVENKNVATIQEYEQKTNSPLQSFDSGC